MSDSKDKAGVMGGQAVVGAGRTRFGRDEDGGSGGGTDGGGGGDRRDRDGDGLCWWEDNVAHIILGMDPNDPLAYAPGLEFHHPIMFMLGDPGGQ